MATRLFSHSPTFSTDLAGVLVLCQQSLHTFRIYCFVDNELGWWFFSLLCYSLILSAILVCRYMCVRAYLSIFFSLPIRCALIKTKPTHITIAASHLDAIIFCFAFIIFVKMILIVNAFGAFYLGRAHEACKLWVCIGCHGHNHTECGKFSAETYNCVIHSGCVYKLQSNAYEICMLYTIICFVRPATRDKTQNEVKWAASMFVATFEWVYVPYMGEQNSIYNVID